MAAQQAVPAIGLFNARNVGVLGQDHYLSPLSHLFVVPAGHDVDQLAVRTIVSRGLAQAGDPCSGCSQRTMSSWLTHCQSCLLRLFQIWQQTWQQCRRYSESKL